MLRSSTSSIRRHGCIAQHPVFCSHVPVDREGIAGMGDGKKQSSVDVCARQWAGGY